MDFVLSQTGDQLEYWTETVNGMYDDYQKYITIFELTYLNKIYINYNGRELTIDMDSLDIINEYDCSYFKIDSYDNNKGIYSIFHNTYHKKTEYTKHKKITCGNKIDIILDSDISIVDMHNFSMKFRDIDLDYMRGGIISEEKLVILNSLTELV